MKDVDAIRRCSRRRFCGFSLALLGSGVAAPPVAAQSAMPVETGFINGQVTANGRTMLYVVYVPRGYTPEKQWPVILFLAGGFTSGSDGFHPLFIDLPRGANFTGDTRPLLTNAGNLGVAVMRNPQRFPCLVVWPQMPSGNDLTEWTGRFQDLALQALEEVVVKYNGDRNRLTVTGVSLGGDGTWDVATDHPNLFAAAMPIAGQGDYAPKKIAQALKSLPIWAFQGDKDDPNWVRGLRATVAAVQAAGNTNVLYTEFPGLGHNVWDMVYDDPKVIGWLLAQKR